MINKEPIHVLLPNGKPVIDASGDKLMRRCVSYECNLELEYIRVTYKEYWATTFGKEKNVSIKDYYVKDIVDHNNGYTKPAFTMWVEKLCNPIISPLINKTLSELSINIETGYVLKEPIF